MTTVTISWDCETVFVPGMMILFQPFCPEEAVQLDLWDWFDANELPTVDYKSKAGSREVDFVFDDEDMAVLFKLTWG